MKRNELYITERNGHYFTSNKPRKQCSGSINLMFMDPCITVQFIKKNPTRGNCVSKFIIPYLYEAQHVLGDTPPIIGNLKLH
jgi:hypothetical protein